MEDVSFQENLSRVLADFENELRFLSSQGVLTQLDIRKMRAKAQVSRDAMLVAQRESTFEDRAKNKLLNALVRDFEKSIQATLDDAVSRKGDRALLVHRLNRIDQKIYQKVQSYISPSDMQSLRFGMDLLKLYILRSIPDKGKRWRAKVDVGQIADDYEQTIMEHIQRQFTYPKLLR